jgi:hypothetical protein
MRTQLAIFKSDLLQATKERWVVGRLGKADGTNIDLDGLRLLA